MNGKSRAKMTVALGMCIALILAGAGIFVGYRFMSADPRSHLVRLIDAGDADGLRTLLRTGADPNKVEHRPFDKEGGSSAIHHAASRNRVACLEVLLEAGGDPNLVDDHGATPLVSALCNEDVSSLRVLIQGGASVEPVSPGAKVPLVVAVQRNNVPAVNMLLENHANPNVIDSDGFTPLYVACAGEVDIGIAELLCRHGADLLGGRIGNRPVDAIERMPDAKRSEMRAIVSKYLRE